MRLPLRHLADGTRPARCRARIRLARPFGAEALSELNYLVERALAAGATEVVLDLSSFDPDRGAEARELDVLVADLKARLDDAHAELEVVRAA
jgi:hypothetical protein